VIAHAGKTLGDGLPELRRELARQGVEDPIWIEIPKSAKAPRQVERALEAGAKLIFLWGGDGTIQRCLEPASGSGAALAILPAGTANLLAGNLGIPRRIEAAVRIGLHGERRKLDVGRLNGDRFAVMAGAGFDASMINHANGALKDRLGRAAYVWTGARSLREKPFKARIAIDGATWYRGKASCILVGNVGHLFGGLEVFEGARPDDGRLEIGIVTADGLVEWARTLARVTTGDPDSSPFVRTTSATKIDVKLDRRVRYEVDGGDRTKVKALKVRVEPSAVTICVPGEGLDSSAGGQKSSDDALA
jgi:YegS/Rv2252/BmrU family lipid kinase